MFHIQTLQDDLRDDKVNIFLLQFYLMEKFEERTLRNGAFPITLRSESRQDLLIVGGNQLSHLNEHLFLFLLTQDLIFWQKLQISFDNMTSLYWFGVFNFDFLPHSIHQTNNKDLQVAVADDAEWLHKKTFHQLAYCHFFIQLHLVETCLAVD